MVQHDGPSGADKLQNVDFSSQGDAGMLGVGVQSFEFGGKQNWKHRI